MNWSAIPLLAPRDPSKRTGGLPSGLPITRVPLPISCDALPAREGSDAFPPMETTRVHHAARRRASRMAARGASDVC